jgi:very-short-patch-repair endonuclease
MGSVGLIPLTSPLRTLIDLAATTGNTTTLERALDEARIRRLVRERDLEALSERYRGHHGLRTLGEILTTQAGPDFSRSEAERRLLRLIREAGLPHPRRNVRVAGWEVDFIWPDHGLIAEVDGYRIHGGRTPFERDRAKTIELEDAGYSVLRLTWKQISEREAWVAARIAERLARRGRAVPMGPAPGA